ncbi:MAG: hypothetical protein U5Q44_04700 [Dehalococcoidia bacterium]|nr:hypothetical protein [Dehalococcoidia bacterium]
MKMVYTNHPEWPKKVELRTAPAPRRYPRAGAVGAFVATQISSFRVAASVEVIDLGMAFEAIWRFWVCSGFVRPAGGRRGSGPGPLLGGRAGAATGLVGADDEPLSRFCRHLSGKGHDHGCGRAVRLADDVAGAHQVSDSPPG